MKSKETIRSDISKLVKKFGNVANLNESNTELKWIEPLMKYLGWKMESNDVFKREQLGGNYTDYTFKINGTTRFILEAKQVGLSLDGTYKNKTFVEQAVDYAKHSDCTWAVLTNFNEFRLYTTDKPENPLVFTIPFTEYANSEFDRLWFFSRESMENRQLNEFGEKWSFKKKKIHFDKILLADLIIFREMLSKDILKSNENLKSDIVRCDEIVQKILDRLIFMRYCEDRGLENKKISVYVGSKNIINKLREIWGSKNEYGYYNSALFAYNDCDNHKVHVTDAVISEVIEGLYLSKQNNARYDFSKIESDVLGSIYEQYLSFIIKRRKKGGLAVSQDKKKEQGIYYTPTYVVDYIVQHTLGKALQGKSLPQIKKIKVLDMACGSGSFLIKAFDVFNQAYRGEFKTKEVIDNEILLLEFNKGDKTLHPNKKCEIIENNIYGVDLDKQAVEIAQLNLLLKIQYKIKLPFTNITCGDSLLVTDTNEVSTGLFEEFDVKKNQFDVIIGNPPYVDIKELDNKIVKRLFAAYKTVENRMNLYSVFVEKGLQLLKDGGYFGFIIPNSILYNESYSKIRKLLLENVCLEEIIRLPDDVFENVKVETIILIFRKNARNQNNSCKVLIYAPDEKINNIGKENAKKILSFKQADWQEEGILNLNLERGTKKILKAIEKNTKPLSVYCDICLGLTPYDKYKGHSKTDIENRVFHSDHAKTKFHKPLLSGEDITRYGVHWKCVIYIKYGDWLGAPREERFFKKPRILVRQIISGNPPSIFAGYSEKEIYNTQIAFNILIKNIFNQHIKIKYLLAILNSRLMTYYHRERYLDPTKKLFQKILIANANLLPIRIAHKLSQTKIEILVTKIISLTSNLYKLDDIHNIERTKLETQISFIDDKINDEIFKLYHIPKHLQKIIEDSLKK